MWGQQAWLQGQLCLGFPGAGSYLRGGGWPGLLVGVQRSGGSSLPTPLKQTAVCLRSGRCWTLHRGAESRQHISRAREIRACDCFFPPLRTELPAETPSEWSSVFCSTAVSAAKIFSTGISSFTLTLNSSSPSRSLFLWRSSWTAAPDKTQGDGGEGRNEIDTAGQPEGRRREETDGSSPFGPCSLIWVMIAIKDTKGPTWGKIFLSCQKEKHNPDQIICSLVALIPPPPLPEIYWWFIFMILPHQH